MPKELVENNFTKGSVGRTNEQNRVYPLMGNGNDWRCQGASTDPTPSEIIAWGDNVPIFKK